MSKTIKQLSEELSITKSSLRHKIELLNLQSKLKKVGNQFVIDDKQEKLIIDYLENNNSENNSTRDKDSDNKKDSDKKNTDNNNFTVNTKTKTEKNTSKPSSASPKHLNNIVNYSDICNNRNKQPYRKSNLISDSHNPDDSNDFNKLIDLYNILREELKAKDLQISALTKQLSDIINQNNQLTLALQNTTESLKSAQALHAGTIKQQLTEALLDNNYPQDFKNLENKKWWHFWK